MSNDFSEVIQRYLQDTVFSGEVKSEEGEVLTVYEGICTVYGLKNIFLGEVVNFENNIQGVCFDLDNSIIRVVILGDITKISNGTKVVGTNKTITIPVGKNILGRILNGLGKPIDGKGDIVADDYSQITNNTLNLSDIDLVQECFYTGITVIDALMPIGRGNSELIMGDKQTGKSSIIIDAIINQSIINSKTSKEEDQIFCIYVSIGQQVKNTASLIKQLEVSGAIKYSCVVAATASDQAIDQYLAPLIGCAIAEYFRDNGKHAVIFYDNLSNHAMAYRQLSLLLKRLPSIQSYPVDTFTLHANLLEKSAQLSEKKGSGSLTSIALADTMLGDITSCTVDNLISITDGQIFLDINLSNLGVRPAISLKNCINNTSSLLQHRSVKEIFPILKYDLEQYKIIKEHSKEILDTDENIQKKLKRGLVWFEIFKQASNKPVPIELQIISLFAASQGYYDDLPIDLIKLCEKDIFSESSLLLSGILYKIKANKDLNYNEEEQVKNFLTNVVLGFNSLVHDTKKVNDNAS